MINNFSHSFAIWTKLFKMVKNHSKVDTGFPVHQEIGQIALKNGVTCPTCLKCINNVLIRIDFQLYEQMVYQKCHLHWQHLDWHISRAWRRH